VLFSLRRQLVFSAAMLFLLAAPQSSRSQAQPPQTAKKPPGGPAAPQSTHYPILLLAFGNEPSWSLRIGLKGPERLDRPGYPPIPLEPAEVTHEAGADSWTYHAKDFATGAVIAVHLTREACTDAISDTAIESPSTTAKYTFRASVDHAQLGTLNGCARIAAELFPKINNQADDDDDADKKKPPAPTITNFKAPVAVAFLNAAQQLVFKRGQAARIVSTQHPSDFSVSHDGKKLLYTLTNSKTEAENTIYLYEFDSGRSKELLGGLVRQPFWSPDDSRIAFLKSVDSLWQVWAFPSGTPENAVALYTGILTSLHGWIDVHTVLASDQESAYWISDDKPLQTLALKEIYGDAFQIMESDTIRVHPLNSVLLLVSASFTTQLPGHAKGDGVLVSSVFLYEVRSKRRVVLTPPDQWARRAEWSRDGLQVLFTGQESRKSPAIYRIFWDGTDFRRYQGGTNLVVGQ